MESSVKWVRTPGELEQLLLSLGPGPTALDTEADSFHRYPEKVCLIQLSDDGRDWLLDPLEPFDLSGLRGPLEQTGRRKILHGADYDIRMLDRDFGLRIHGLFDTMVAARLVGERAFGLAALLDRYLGVTLDKRFQRADWSQRPLTAEMEAYAVLDTRHLADLAGILEQKLEEKGRAGWAREEFERLERLRFTRKADDPDAFQRVKGSGRLDGRGLAVLRELFRLRETLARSRDRPPFRIFRDDLLLQLSHTRPSNVEALLIERGLPRSWHKPAAAQRLMEAIARGVQLPASELPERRPRRPFRDPALDKGVRSLQVRRDRLAGELELDPSILAPRAVLEQIERCRLEGQDPREVPDLRHWQAELLLD